MHTIYALMDPVTREIRYVGRSRDVQRRFRDHCSACGNLARMNKWIKSLKRAGLLPILRILARCRNWFRAGERERALIRAHAGERLFNIKAHVHYRRRPGVRGIQRAALS